MTTLAGTLERRCLPQPTSPARARSLAGGHCTGCSGRARSTTRAAWPTRRRSTARPTGSTGHRRVRTGGAEPCDRPLGEPVDLP